MIQYTAPLIIKRAPNVKTGTFSGLASTWSVDRQGERIQRGAFQKTIAALSAGTQRVAVLHMHDARQLLGSIKAAQETDDGLAVDGEIVLGTETADRAHQMLLAQAAGLSVGFMAGDEDTYRDEAGIKTYRAVDLMEVSVVGVPANRQSIAHQVRHLDLMTHAEFKAALLAGDSLPPMPRALVNKLAAIAFRDAPPDDFDLDPAHEGALYAAIAAVKLSFTRK